MSLIGNATTPASYVADYMQACVGMLGIPAGGFTADIEAFGASTDYNVEQLYASMLNSSIGRSIYAPGSSDTTFATNLVAKLGGSLLSADMQTWAIDYAKSMLADGASRANVAMTFVEAVSNVESTDADFGALAQQFANRIEIANYYTFSSTSPSTTLGTLQNVISGVTNTTNVTDPAAVLQSNTQVTTGQSYTLTTGADNIIGTTAGDTVAGVYDTSAGTFGNADSINGGAGTDTLSVRVTTASADTVSPALSAIEVITIDNDVVDAAGTTNEFNLNTGSAAGITNVNSSGSSAGSLTNVNNLAASVTVGMTNAKGVLALDFATTVFNTSADSITVNLEGAGDAASGGVAATLVLDGTVTGGTTAVTSDNTLESITITSNTTASRVDLVGGSAVKTINASGNAKLILTDATNTFSAVTTVAAADLGATLDIDLSSNTKDLTVTTGSGDDRIKIGAIGTGLTSADTINLGSGTDTVAVSDTSFDATDLTLIKTELTTAETLEFYSTIASASYNLSDVSVISNFKFSGTNVGTAAAALASGATAGAGATTIAIAGVESGDSITFSASSTGGAGQVNGSSTALSTGGVGGAAISIAPNIDGGSDAVTINLTGGVTLTGGAGGAVVAGASSSGSTSGNGGVAISASGFETLNIVSTGTTANAIAGGAAGATGQSGDVIGSAGASIVVNTNATINVSGTKDLNLGTVSGTNVTIDASTFTGKLTVTGEAGNNVIKGGSAVDTIDGGAGIDTITGNGGADVINFKLGTGTTDSGSRIISGLGGSGTANTTADVTAVQATDSITDYTKGSDLISITDSAAAAVTLTSAMIDVNTTASAGTAAINSSGIASFNANDDTLIEKAIAVAMGIKAADSTSAGDLAVFEDNGSTYVFVSDSTDGLTDGDLVIKLTGVTGVSSVSFSNGDMVLS